MRLRRDRRTVVQSSSDAICGPNGLVSKKGKQIINLGAIHLERGCCTSDTAVATNCA